MPVYTSDPAWCDITYSYTVTVPSGDAAVTFDADRTVRTFSFEYLTSLDLSGLTFIDYTVKVIGQVGEVRVI